ncbi:MAG: hypothetical protein KF757_03540 [Phycisphaeraceae bacterium]|nr:hypothetical protein [Phycisphaeraceae bacterium]MCW5763077.1 hypothetical protein [Phycisphaeraceae bacterium]
MKRQAQGHMCGFNTEVSEPTSVTRKASRGGKIVDTVPCKFIAPLDGGTGERWHGFTHLIAGTWQKTKIIS